MDDPRGETESLLVTSTMVERYDNTGIEVRRRLEWTDGVWVWEAPHGCLLIES